MLPLLANKMNILNRPQIKNLGGQLTPPWSGLPVPLYKSKTKNMKTKAK